VLGAIEMLHDIALYKFNIHIHIHIRVTLQLKSVGTSLSTRQLLRVARRLSAYPNEHLYDVLHKACLAKYVRCLYQYILSHFMYVVALSE